MGFVDIAVLLAIIVIVGAALAYIIVSKLRGRTCIGCPDSKSCSAARSASTSGKCTGSCSSCSACHGCSGNSSEKGDG